MWYLKRNINDFWKVINFSFVKKWFLVKIGTFKFFSQKISEAYKYDKNDF